MLRSVRALSSVAVVVSLIFIGATAGPLLEVVVEIAISHSNFLRLSLAETNQSFLLMIVWTLPASGVALAPPSTSGIASLG